MFRRARDFASLTVGALFGASAALAQDHHTGKEEVGRIDFPVSCNQGARERFQRATAMLHSFWWEAAEREYPRALEVDPTCGMAHWGIAMTLLGNPFTRVSPPDTRLRDALAAAEKARALTLYSTRREQLYAE